MTPLALAVGGLDSSSLILLLSMVGLVSFALVFVTSFVKIVIVLGLLRSALGTPRIPPTSVITGIAIILSFYIMYPVFSRVVHTAAPSFLAFQSTATASGSPAGPPGQDKVRELVQIVKQSSEPLRTFLSRHAHKDEKRTFNQLSQELQKDTGGEAFGPESFRVLIPAFLISEIKEAFLIGFLLFLPFLILDLLAANILMALGMHMLSPTSVSLPFKLLLFVSVDGFALLSHALVKSYMVT